MWCSVCVNCIKHVNCSKCFSQISSYSLSFVGTLFVNKNRMHNVCIKRCLITAVSMNTFHLLILESVSSSTNFAPVNHNNMLPLPEPNHPFTNSLIHN